MKQLSEKSFKDLAEMTLVLAERFFMARRLSQLEEEEYIAESDSYIEECHFFLKKVSDAFNTLNESEKNLINNEFFFQNYHNWWETIYSKATFYRYKKSAMIKFLGAFYHD